MGVIAAGVIMPMIMPVSSVISPMIRPMIMSMRVMMVSVPVRLGLSRLLPQAAQLTPQ